MVAKAPQCSARVYTNSYMQPTANCSRSGVVEHEGRLYCRQHDPVAVQTRRDAAEKRSYAESDAFTLRQRHERIGRLVEEHGKVLRVLTNGTMDIRGVNALQAILKECES